MKGVRPTGIALTTGLIPLPGKLAGGLNRGDFELSTRRHSELHSP